MGEARNADCDSTGAPRRRSETNSCRRGSGKCTTLSNGCSSAAERERDDTHDEREERRRAEAQLVETAQVLVILPLVGFAHLQKRGQRAPLYV